jgi:hypothetical protein
MQKVVTDLNIINYADMPISAFPCEFLCHIYSYFRRTMYLLLSKTSYNEPVKNHAWRKTFWSPARS